MTACPADAAGRPGRAVAASRAGAAVADRAAVAAGPAVTASRGSGRYTEAAILLYVVAVVPLARRRRWLIALAAAPIHLVALAGSLASIGMADKVFFHVGFGLAAGLLGWGMAFSIDRCSPAQSTAVRLGQSRKEYLS